MAPEVQSLSVLLQADAAVEILLQAVAVVLLPARRKEGAGINNVSSTNFICLHFDLPSSTFCVYHSNNQRDIRVEDRIFQSFIFHPYLPSSTYCFKAKIRRKCWSSAERYAFLKQIHLLKYFVFPCCLTGNGAICIRFRAGVPMSPGTRAHESVYPGL